MATVLITGASRGIGLEMCRQLQARGDEAIAACRQATPELDALGIRVIENIDVSSHASVAQLAAALKGQKLDWLVNNAGILTIESLLDLDFDRIRREFEVNTLGPLRVTSSLLDNLQPGSRVGIVSSRVGSLADNGSGGLYGYRISKTAVNMVGVNLSIDLKERGIAVALLHPGMVATEMTGRQGIEVPTAARGLLARMDALTLETTGTFWHAEGYQLPW